MIARPTRSASAPAGRRVYAPAGRWVSAPPGRGASAPERAILNHPDQRTSWIAVMIATLADPPPDAPATIERRLREICADAPILSARWRRGRWRTGTPPECTIVDGDPVDSPLLQCRLALDREPPLRVLLSSDCRQLALAAHHAALDGRGTLALIAALLGAPLPPPVGVAPGVGARRSLREPLRRVLAPADRVAPSSPQPAQESFAVRELATDGWFTGRIVQACVAAAAARNARLEWPWRRIGLSVALGGPVGMGNFASYRRVDLGGDERVARAVHRALSEDDVPPELVSAPRILCLLTPLAARFSDSMLISNLGLVAVPGVERLAFFPVVHGRSAVSFGASEVEHGAATLCLRARDLSQVDADSLLDDAVSRLGGGRTRREPDVPGHHHPLQPR